MRKIYEFLTAEQKREAVRLLKSDRLELQQEMDRHINDYPKIVRDVLLHTLDCWALEIAQLEEDFANEHH